MPRQVLNSERYHVPVPGFSHAVLAPETGRLLYLSGLTARTAPPASTAVQIERLYDPRQLIEIEATAVVAAHSVSARGT